MAHLTNFSFEFFHQIFTEDASLLFLYHGAKKVKNDQKLKSRGSCLKLIALLLLSTWLMGAIHKMAATLGDSPSARPLRGNFSSQRSLPHLAKHSFLGFLFLLGAKKHHANQNLFGSTPPSRHNAEFCFHWAK